MADPDSIAFKAMEDGNKSISDNVVPKDKSYDFSAMGKDASGVSYKGFTNVDDKSIYWQHPKNQLLYSSEGKRSGYMGIDKKAHFGIPKFDPIETKNELGEITSQRVIKTGSLEDVWTSSEDVGSISNKYLTEKEGQKYHGYSFPE